VFTRTWLAFRVRVSVPSVAWRCAARNWHYYAETAERQYISPIAISGARDREREARNPKVLNGRECRSIRRARLPRTLGRGRECSIPWSHRRLRNLGEQRVGYRERLVETENTLILARLVCSRKRSRFGIADSAIQNAGWQAKWSLLLLLHWPVDFWPKNSVYVPRFISRWELDFNWPEVQT